MRKWSGHGGQAGIRDHCAMGSTLSTDRVQAVLARLRRTGEGEDEPAKLRVRDREAELGDKVYGAERAALGAQAPLSITPAAGKLLYALTIAVQPSLIVEFGTSLGYSTIHFASALQDLGSGSIITTELLADKARLAARNVADAGLSGCVEIRHGNALGTLADLDTDVDLLFLDGSNDLYISVLELVEPRLTARALIVADMSHQEPHPARYREYVNDPSRGYLTTEIPIDAGIVVSTQDPASARDRVSPASGQARSSGASGATAH